MIEEPKSFTVDKRKIKNFVITDEVLSTINYLSSLGLEPIQIAEYFGLEWYDWLIKTTQHPEIKESIRMGKGQGVFIAAKKLNDHIKMGSLKATTFYLETKGGFNKPDPKAQENALEQQNEVDDDGIDYDDPIEASKAYQKYMSGD